MTEPRPALTMTLGKSLPHFGASVSPGYVGEGTRGGLTAGGGGLPSDGSDVRLPARLCRPPSQHPPPHGSADSSPSGQRCR